MGDDLSRWLPDFDGTMALPPETDDSSLKSPYKSIFLFLAGALTLAVVISGWLFLKFSHVLFFEALGSSLLLSVGKGCCCCMFFLSCWALRSSIRIADITGKSFDI